MSGCGKTAIHTLRCEGMACVWMNDLRKRAAFEMDCPIEQLQVVAIDARTRGVSGCSKKRTYVMGAAMSAEQAKSWLMN